MQAKLKQEQWVEKFTASADRSPGDIVEAPSGRAGVVLGTRVVKSGDEGTLDVGYNVYEIQNVEGSTNPSDGDQVAWDISEDELVAGGAGTADFYVGTVENGGQGAGNPVRVRMNMPAIPSVGA